MSAQRTHDKMMSLLHRLIWVEEALAVAMRAGDRARLERLEGLGKRLAEGLTLAMSAFSTLPDDMADRIRQRVMELRQKRDVNARLVAETRVMCERFFGRDGSSGYRRDGRPSGRETRTFVRLTA